MSELNNWLQHQEDEEREGHAAENKSVMRDRALLALGLLAGVGAAAGGAGKANADELLLCTYWHPEVGIGTDINDPIGDSDQVSTPDLTSPLVLDPAVSQKVYKGYVLKNMTEYVEGGTNDWRIFKKINGQDIQVGILDGMGGQFIGLMTDSGVFYSGGKFYKVTDTGTTLSSQEIGELPLPGMAGMTSFGGHVFINYKEGGKEMLAAFNEQEILNHDPGSGLIPIASLKDITPPKVTSQWSLGMDFDASTGELIIPQKQGVTPVDFSAFLDEDGQLPPDFSLTDVDAGTFKDLGVSTVGTLASNGYRYHGIAGGAGIIMQTPTGQTVTMGKEQLNGGTGIQLSTMYELVHGGIYVIFNNDPDSLTPVPPVVLHEDGSITQDPGDMTPFIKKCFVIPEEYHDMFKPVADPCEGVTCPPSAEQCKEAVCDSQTGDCEETAKPNGTTCDADANACTIGDACADGQCAPGAPKTCAEPAEQCKQSAGCDADTGNCLVENKTNGTTCDDGNPDTENDKCAGGVCEGTPIQVEPEPEEDPDVVEQEVEQEEEIIEGELVEEGEIEPDEDVVEQDDSSDTTDAVDAAEIEQETDSAEPEADTADQKPGTEVDSSGEDLAGDDANGETSEEAGSDTPVPQIDEETPGETPPGCSCKVANTQRQQRGLTEMLSVLGLAALGVVGLRRRKETE